MEEKQKKESKFWTWIDNAKGDKVVWIILFLLIMISTVSIFASTSLLKDGSNNRFDILIEHLGFIGIGIVLVLIINKFGSLKIFRAVAKWGFILSFIALVLLAVHVDMGFIKFPEINGARRVISVFGQQIHIFELVKLGMVMYLAWIMSEIQLDEKEEGHLALFHKIGTIKHLEWIEQGFFKRCILVYAPVMIVFVLTMMGSNSSALCIIIICFFMLIVGGMPKKEIYPAPLLIAVMLAGAICINRIADREVFPRAETLVSRIFANYSPSQLDGKKGEEFDAIRDRIKQPYGARIAVHEGGFFGKGIGKSTQKYSVVNMYADFMFSFILEEGGLFWAFWIIVIYVSLIARASTITRNLTDDFAKYAVGGLCLMISIQAFLVMAYNVGIGPMTGQTLPIISHGSFAFLVFCIAFGVILSISKMAYENIHREQEAAEPIYEHAHREDEVRDAMSELNDFESEN